MSCFELNYLWRERGDDHTDDQCVHAKQRALPSSSKKRLELRHGVAILHHEGCQKGFTALGRWLRVHFSQFRLCRLWHEAHSIKSQTVFKVEHDNTNSNQLENRAPRPEPKI